MAFRHRTRDEHRPRSEDRATRRRRSLRSAGTAADDRADHRGAGTVLWWIRDPAERRSRIGGRRGSGPGGARPRRRSHRHRPGDGRSAVTRRRSDRLAKRSGRGFRRDRSHGVGGQRCRSGDGVVRPQGRPLREGTWRTERIGRPSVNRLAAERSRRQRQRRCGRRGSGGRRRGRAGVHSGPSAATPPVSPPPTTGRTRSVHALAWWGWAVAIAFVALSSTNLVALAATAAAIALVLATCAVDSPTARAATVFLRFGLGIVAIRVALGVLLGSKPGGHVLVRLPSATLPGWAAGISVGGPVSVEVLVDALAQGAQLGVALVALGAVNALCSPYRLLRLVPAERGGGTRSDPYGSAFARSPDSGPARASPPRAPDARGRTRPLGRTGGLDGRARIRPDRHRRVAPAPDPRCDGARHRRRVHCRVRRRGTGSTPLDRACGDRRERRLVRDRAAGRVDPHPPEPVPARAVGPARLGHRARRGRSDRRHGCDRRLGAPRDGTTGATARGSMMALFGVIILLPLFLQNEADVAART